MVDLEDDPYYIDRRYDPVLRAEPVGHGYLDQDVHQRRLGQSAGPRSSTPRRPFWNSCTGNSTAFSGHPLWLASYGVSDPALPSGWNNLTFWQYTSNGTISGIKGGTDLDYLGPVLQVSQVGKAIAPVRLRTLNSLDDAAVSYTPGALPPGLHLSAAGQITGTPSAIGSYTATVTTSAGAVPATMTFTWDVHGTLTVNSPGNRTTSAGSAVSLRISVSDQDAGSPVSLAASGLPAGLSMSAAGLITGWPSKPGTYKVTVSASDGLHATGSASFTWTVAAAAGGVAGPVRQVGGSGRCLNDPQASTKNGTLVNLWGCDGRSNQNWTVAQDGTLRMLGKCLDVAGESKASGARLQLWSCASGDGAQQWQAGTDGELVNPQSGKCLYVPAANAANGTRPVLWTCANVTTQSSEHWNRPAARRPVRRARQVPGRRRPGRLRERGGRALDRRIRRDVPRGWPVPDRDGHDSGLAAVDRALQRRDGHQVDASPRRPDRHRDRQRRLRPVRIGPAQRHHPGHRTVR